MPSAEILLTDHVTLQCECIDRIYLNGYIPTLQVPGQLVKFLQHRGYPIPSPVAVAKLTQRFVHEIEKFASVNKIPLVRFTKKQRKEDVAHTYFDQLQKEGRFGVAMIGVAQERTTGFKGVKLDRPDAMAWFQYSRASVCVNQYYFYILDSEFGPSFIKMSSYAPFSIRVWLNGHEWAKRQLARTGATYGELDNGFLSVENPSLLQETCDRLCEHDMKDYFRRWTAVLPSPLTADDRNVGYQHKLSILQLEISLTQVFDRPLRGRQFFERVIRDNLDLGRPDRVQLIFNRRVTKRTPGYFRTRVLTRDVDPSLHVDYKHSKIKQYYKNGRALRTELTINNTYDFGIPRGLPSLKCLRDLGKRANRRLIDAQCASFQCSLTPTTFQEVVLPSNDTDGQKIPGLRFGDPRVMALMSALCGFFHLPGGFRNGVLRQRVAQLLERPDVYSPGRMTYDLRRLLLNGLVRRVPRTQTYVVTERGRRVTLVFSKVHARVLQPAPLDPGAPDEANPALQRAWRAVDRAIDSTIRAARLAA
jgi:hypothetical protein